MSEDFFDQNPNEKVEAGENVPAGEDFTERPRMRRHIPRAEKVSPFSASHPVRDGGGYDTRGDYQQRSYNQNYPRQERPAYQGGYNNHSYNSYDGGGYPQNDSYRQGRGGYQQNRGGYDNNMGDGYPNYNRRSQPYYQQRPQRPYNQNQNYNNRGPQRMPADYEGYNNMNGRPYGNRPSGYSNYGRQPYAPASKPAPARPKKNVAKNAPRPILRYKEENFDPSQPIRLNKFLANAGVCSRRESDKYIEAGLVSVNGVVVKELGTKVLRTDEVRFHDQLVKLEDKIYIVLNKPRGYITTSDDPLNRKTVMALVKNACPERIYPIGRLDRNTTGVLMLTNDGDMASKLMHPKFLKKKIYHVHLDKAVTAADMKQILDGIELEDGMIKADAIEYASDADKKQVGIEIHSGRNRIVRRIFEHLGYRVVKLDRVYFAGLTKKNLRRGEWRFLTEEEVRILRMGAYE